jgi:hypothetical protein
VWRLRDNETGRVQDIMPALPWAPSYDEIAERLMWQSRARLKESRQLLEAAKQTLRKTWEMALAMRRGVRLPREHGGQHDCSRGARNREHPVTVRATEETNILHLSDARRAPGFTDGTRGRWLQEQAEACGASSSCFSFRKVSRVERWALWQRDDHQGGLATSDLLSGRGGLVLRHELVDAGETLGGVIAFE